MYEPSLATVPEVAGHENTYDHTFALDRNMNMNIDQDPIPEFAGVFSDSDGEIEGAGDWIAGA